MDLTPVSLNVVTVLIEIALLFGGIFLIQVLVDSTLVRLSRWFRPDAELNPFIMARNLFDRCVQTFLSVGCLMILLINGYLLYQGRSVHQVAWDLVSGVPRERWQMLALGTVKSLLLLVLVTFVIAYLRPWLQRLGDRLKSWQNITANDHSIDQLLWTTELGLGTGLWLGALILCLRFLFVPQRVMNYCHFIVECYFIICLGIIFIQGIFAVITTLDALADAYIAHHPRSILRFYPRFRHLLGLIKRCLEYAIYVAIAGILLNQISLFRPIAKYAIDINQVITVIVIAALTIELSNITVESLLLRSRNLDPFQRRRRLTFIPLLQNTLRYCIYFGAGVAILYIFDIDPTPILAGAGIVGLAVGLGAQNLINDLVNGFTILLQNYYLVGDFVETDTATGIVEDMDLRVTRIRATDGTLHIVRNGDVKTIVNYSKEFVYAVVYVGVDYDSNLDHVYRVLTDVGKQVKELHPDVLEPTRVDGLDNFAESELTIRTSTKVKPGKHLPVQRLVRKLIKEAFDREQVEIPFARRVLIFKNGDEVESPSPLPDTIDPSSLEDGQL